MKSLYWRLKEADITIDNHYSDLYFRATPEAMEIFRKFLIDYHETQHTLHYNLFKSNLDQQMWIDVPFAYDPYWEDKNVRG